MQHRVGSVVYYFGRTVHRITRPLLHGCSVYVLLCMLMKEWVRARKLCEGLTSKVIHEIGWSSGIAVLLTIFRLKETSSNANVNMAPGGVHVPTIKWWIILRDGNNKDGGKRDVVRIAKVRSIQQLNYVWPSNYRPSQEVGTRTTDGRTAIEGVI